MVRLVCCLFVCLISSIFIYFLISSTLQKYFFHLKKTNQTAQSHNSDNKDNWRAFFNKETEESYYRFFSPLNHKYWARLYLNGWESFLTFATTLPLNLKPLLSVFPDTQPFFVRECLRCTMAWSPHSIRVIFQWLTLTVKTGATCPVLGCRESFTPLGRWCVSFAFWFPTCGGMKTTGTPSGSTPFSWSYLPSPCPFVFIFAPWVSLSLLLLFPLISSYSSWCSVLQGVYSTGFDAAVRADALRVDLPACLDPCNDWIGGHGPVGHDSLCGGDAGEESPRLICMALLWTLWWNQTNNPIFFSASVIRPLKSAHF